MTAKTTAELKDAITPLVPESWTDANLTDLIDSMTPYVQDADPGAVGAGRVWIRTTDNLQQTYVRNADNDGWSFVSLQRYDGDGNRRWRIQDSAEFFEIDYFDAEGNAVATIDMDDISTIITRNNPDDRGVQLDSHGFGLRLGGAGGDAGFHRPRWLKGSVDPTAGAGIAAGEVGELTGGSMYSRDDGDGLCQLWMKTGPADTDWSQIAGAV